MPLETIWALLDACAAHDRLAWQGVGVSDNANTCPRANPKQNAKKITALVQIRRISLWRSE